MFDRTDSLVGGLVIPRDEATARRAYLIEKRERARTEYLRTNPRPDFDERDIELEDSDEQEELDFLSALLKNSESCSGQEFIEDDYFEDYARVEACEVFMLVDTIADFVDWERWATHARQDYKDVAPPGYTYWCRS